MAGSKPGHRVVAPGPRDGVVRSGDEELVVPAGWAFLPSGDAGLTRRVKSLGPCWTVMARRGRRRVSIGVWTDATRIHEARRAVSAQRASPEYKRRQQADARRRREKQRAYVHDFQRAVVAFLDFAPRFSTEAVRMGRLVAAQATPVGSGTVGRTERIPLGARAEAAVIAWLRHHTTAYDAMNIPRVKGHRRLVRRELAKRSRKLLERYRRGDDVAEGCPLQRALRSLDGAEPSRSDAPNIDGAPGPDASAARVARGQDRAISASVSRPDPSEVAERMPPSSEWSTSVRVDGVAAASEPPKDSPREASSSEHPDDPVMAQRRARAAAVKERLARGRGAPNRRRR